MALYDSIGHGYRERRRPDPRLAAQIHAALSGCRRIVNVGAGAGSYEPDLEGLVAVEPSDVMIRQRAPAAAPAVRAWAQQLPFRDASFDASLAILTIHHWQDLARGLGELRRVAGDRVVVLTFDTEVGGFWLTDYFPEIPSIDGRMMPTLERVEELLGTARIEVVPVPADCTDGFLGAYWRRPEVYLDADARAAISIFSMLPDVDRGLERLRDDLASGAWERRYAELLGRDSLDLGYRLVVASA